jgi:hypothetical protein
MKFEPARSGQGYIVRQLSSQAVSQQFCIASAVIAGIAECEGLAESDIESTILSPVQTAGNSDREKFPQAPNQKTTKTHPALFDAPPARVRGPQAEPYAVDAASTGKGANERQDYGQQRNWHDGPMIHSRAANFIEMQIVTRPKHGGSGSKNWCRIVPRAKYNDER